MTRILAGAAAVAAALFLAPSPSSAASFNCRLASLPAELLICNDGRLGALDERMARRYALLVNTAPPDVVLQIRAEQKAWIRGRNLCGYDGRCVANAYRHRIGQLREWSELIDGGPPRGPFVAPPPEYGPFAGPPIGPPPPGFYGDDEAYGPPPGFYEEYPPDYYGGEDDEGVVPFEDPGDGYYYDDDDSY
jgi:uncharacterized protein YecT (DUF1311 family)